MNTQNLSAIAQNAGQTAINNVANNLANNINNGINNTIYGAGVPGSYVQQPYGSQVVPGVNSMIQDPRGVGAFVPPQNFIDDPIARSMQFPYSNRSTMMSSSYMDPKRYDDNTIYFPNDSPRDISILDYGEDAMQVTVSNPYGDPWVREYSGGNRIRHVVNDYYREMNGRNLPEIYYTNWRCNGAPVRMEDKLRDLASPAPAGGQEMGPEAGMMPTDLMYQDQSQFMTGAPAMQYLDQSAFMTPTTSINLGVPAMGSVGAFGGVGTMAPEFDKYGSGTYVHI